MEFLLEIYTEEMPPSHVNGALSQLKTKLEEALRANDLVNRKDNVGSIKTYGTCRRLTVLGDLVAYQRDREEVVTGPPKSVSYSPDGIPTAAAIGFAQSQGVPVDRLTTIENKKGEYVGLKKTKKGNPIRDILPLILPGIISSLTFPKMMRWGKNPFKFSRPIKNILSLLDGKLLPFSVAELATTNFTFGHKIHLPGKLHISSFSEYRKMLKASKVIVDQDERKKIIQRKIDTKLAKFEAQLLPDNQLFAKLTYDVEYPYVFLGTFPQEYLKLPMDILSTAMREGQHLFSVIKKRKQLPFFVGVADSFKDSKSLILKGNERILRARLEDAKFFWDQDLRIPMKKRSRALSQIVFQEGLGTYEDKTRRMKKVVSYLSDKLDAKKGKKLAVEAADLCKSDLLTDMVREFPSLQGKVGGLYAKEEGYAPDIWKAIYEHYQPVSLEDEPPTSLFGAILSIADKLDSVVGAVGIGIEISGSKDPFGLRRQAQGVCQVILKKKLDFSFRRFLEKVVDTYGERFEKDKERIKSCCLDFFTNRIQFIYESMGYRYDLVKACLAPGIENVYYSFLRLKALDGLKESAHFEPMILIAKRVNNIIRGFPPYRVNEELLEEKEERELFTAFTVVRDNVLPLISQGEFTKAQRIVFQMRSSVNDFFDHVLVMVDDKRIRRNRIALLQEISKLLSKIADYSQIVVEG